MLELHLSGPNELELRERKTVGSLTEDEVRIRPIFAGICGSDLSVFKGKIPYAAYPLTPGHELLGIVVDAGTHSEHLLGQRVVVSPNTFCGECVYCRNGHTNICSEKKSMGVNVDGCFSEEVTMDAKYVLPVPDDLSNERAALTEPLAVVVHALKKVDITSETTLAIIGCGNEGMFAAALAHSMGARVTAIDINPDKLERVRALGISQTREPGEMREPAFDVVVEAAGTKQSVEQAISLVRPGGTCVLIGITEEASLPVYRVVRSEIALLGSIIYNFPLDFTEAMQHLRKETFKAEHIISKMVPFSEAQDAYRYAMSGGHGKVLLDFR